MLVSVSGYSFGAFVLVDSGADQGFLVDEGVEGEEGVGFVPADGIR